MEEKINSGNDRIIEKEVQDLNLYNSINTKNPVDLTGLSTAINMIESYNWNNITAYVSKISSYDWGAVANSTNRINSYDWGAIANSINRINSFDLSALNSSIRRITEFYSQIDYSQVVESLRKSMSGVNKSVSKLVELYGNDSFRKSMDNIGKTLSQSIDLEFIERINSINIAEVINSMPESSIVDVANEIYNMAETEHNEDDQGITEEIVEEVINSANSNEKGWQESLHDINEKLKRKYWVLYVVGWIIFNVFVLPYLSETIGLPVMTKIRCALREQPHTDSNTVIELQEGDEALILDDINYYYRIEFTDKNGDKKIGYVAKKNVEIIENDE